MVRNSFISVISQKENEENIGSIEFQVFSFTTKIRRLTSHLELHKKRLFISESFAKIFGKTSTTTGFFVKKIEYVIKN